MEGLEARGPEWSYPAIEHASADLPLMGSSRPSVEDLLGAGTTTVALLATP